MFNPEEVGRFYAHTRALFAGKDSKQTHLLPLLPPKITGFLSPHPQVGIGDSSGT